MTAQDFRISFPYGATSAPYSPTRPHRGNDRACPTGTPVVIAGVQIGTVGMTGLATGPHLHTQAGTDIGCQNTVNPTPYEFKAGTVVNTGRGTQWGNFVTVQVGNMYIAYCHLNSINVTKGQVIKEATMADKVNLGTARILAESILGRDRGATHAGQGDGDLNQNHVGRDLTNDYIYSLWTSAEAGAYENYQVTVEGFYRTYKDQIAELSSRPTKAQLEALGKSLQESQAKVAEAEKALEEAKKQGGISPEDSAAIKETNNLIKQLTEWFKQLFRIGDK